MNNLDKIRKIRTYSSDLGEVVEKQQGKTIKAAIEEEENMRTEKERHQNLIKKNTLFGLGGIFLVLAGIISIFLFLTNKKTIDTGVIIKTMIFTENKISVDLKDIPKEKINEEIAKKLPKDFSPDTTTNAVITYNNQPIGTSDLFNYLGIQSWDTLKNSLMGEFTWGIYKDQDKNLDSFLLFKINSYYDTLSEMEKFEKEIPKSFTDVFDLQYDSANVVSFEDDFIANKNARVLKDKEGKIVILYSIIDKKYLLFTTKESTVEKVISLLN